MVWLYTLLSVVAVGSVSLVGVMTLAIREKFLRQIIFSLVAMATGALFGNVLFQLLPEIFEQIDPIFAGLMVLLGIILFFSLEKFFHWRHRHHLDGHSERNVNLEPEIKPLGYLSLFADGLHNFLDGVIIAIGYLAALPIGLATTVAIIFHEIPQEIGDFAILLHSGFSKKRALLINLLSASVAVTGAVLALLIGGRLTAFNNIFLPLAAGGFLYIAGSDLVPELHKITEVKRSIVQLVAFITGAALMLLLALWG